MALNHVIVVLVLCPRQIRLAALVAKVSRPVVGMFVMHAELDIRAIIVSLVLLDTTAIRAFPGANVFPVHVTFTEVFMGLATM